MRLNREVADLIEIYKAADKGDRSAAGALADWLDEHDQPNTARLIRAGMCRVRGDGGYGYGGDGGGDGDGGGGDGGDYGYGDGGDYGYGGGGDGDGGDGGYGGYGCILSKSVRKE